MRLIYNFRATASPYRHELDKTDWGKHAPLKGNAWLHRATRSSAELRGQIGRELELRTLA